MPVTTPKISMTRVASAVCLVLLAGGAAAVGAEPAPAAAGAKADSKVQTVDLRPRYTQGQVIKFTQRTQRSDAMTLVMPGAPGGEGSEKKEGAAPGRMSSTTSVDHTIGYTLRVDQVDKDGTVSMSLEITSIKADVTTRSGKSSWDSTSPPDDGDIDNPAAISYKPVLTSVTKIKLGPDGSVLEVKPDPGLMGPPRTEIGGIIQGLTGSDPIRARWGPLLWIKDGVEPAAVGTSWTNVEVMAAPPVGRFETTTKNTLESVSGDLAQISISGEQKLLDFAPDRPAQGKLTEASLSGSAVWDLKAGTLKSHTWRQKTTLDVNANGISALRTSEITMETTRQD
jgi:hypothetical protein